MKKILKTLLPYSSMIEKYIFLHKILQKVGNHQISTIINEFSMFFLKIYNNAFSVFSEHSNKKYGFHPYY